MNEEIGGHFDGGTIDSGDQIWWAIWQGSKVIRIDPETKQIQKISIDKFKRTTSVAFGGPDYKTMLVTSCGYDFKTKEWIGGDHGGICLITFKDDTKGVEPGIWNGCE